MKNFINTLFRLINIKFFCLISSLLLIGFPFQTHSEDRFEFPKKDFSIVLPQDWKEIPHIVITQKNKEIQKRFPTESLISYDLGFQKVQSKIRFEYPYILICFKEGEKIRETELNALKKNYATTPNFLKSIHQI